MIGKLLRRVDCGLLLLVDVLLPLPLDLLNCWISKLDLTDLRQYDLEYGKFGQNLSSLGCSWCFIGYGKRTCIAN